MKFGVTFFEHEPMHWSTIRTLGKTMLEFEKSGLNIVTEVNDEYVLFSDFEMNPKEARQLAEIAFFEYHHFAEEPLYTEFDPDEEDEMDEAGFLLIDVQKKEETAILTFRNGRVYELFTFNLQER